MSSLHEHHDLHLLRRPPLDTPCRFTPPPHRRYKEEPVLLRKLSTHIINKLNVLNQTPLMVASMSCHEPCVTWLLTKVRDVAAHQGA